MKKCTQYLAMLILSIALMPTGAEAQNWRGKKTLNGEGPLVKKTLDIDNFESIGLGLQATVYLTQGNNYKVEIEAQQNIIDELNKEVKNGSWSIGFDENYRVNNYKRATVWITMPTIESMAIGGSGDIIGETPFKNLGDLKISIGGSGNITFAGDAEDLKLSIAGSGKIKAEDLKVDNAKVSIAGSGTTYLHVDNGDLDVSIAGSGKVYYKGKAGIKTSIAGSGSVSSIE